MAQVWSQALERLRPEVGGDALELWLKPIKPGQLQDGVLDLAVPNKFFSEKIEAQFQARIQAVLREITGENLALRLQVAAAPGAQSRPPETTGGPRPAPPDFPVTDLNPRYTFSTFIVGTSNRFAHATAEAIVRNPGHRFNPFFLYGGVGLGKTHLLHAIGNNQRKEAPRTRVLYTTAERFVNEYIDSLRYDKPDAFRSKFRNLDCLLIDDIQFLIAKGRSEEEFFHTFNSLFDSRKQIVISSDRAPQEMAPQEQRLISRFLSGVVADIKPPDFETRMAILRRKAEEESLRVPDDVVEFISKAVKTSIRELEGALTRVAAYGVVVGTPLTVDLAKEILKDILSGDVDSPIVRIETIQDIVASKYSLSLADLKSAQRTAAIAFPRQLAMYLACQLTSLSTPEIGRAFGGKDHTTVIHARDKLRQMVERDPFFLEQVNKIINQIRAVDNQ